jgi:hypothetical protein
MSVKCTGIPNSSLFQFNCQRTDNGILPPFKHSTYIIPNSPVIVKPENYVRSSVYSSVNRGAGVIGRLISWGAGGRNPPQIHRTKRGFYTVEGRAYPISSPSRVLRVGTDSKKLCENIKRPFYLGFSCDNLTVKNATYRTKTLQNRFRISLWEFPK